jgi:pimeloyl-[acyl-carrier protein] methyl ester esterase
VSLHVEREGDGPDLVLLHGWGLHSGAWAETRPALARQFCVHAVDLPGHGRSAHVPAGGFDAAVELVAESTPAGAIVCGWSLGGLIAQGLARQAHPMRAVALVATTPCFTTRGDWPHAMRPATLQAFAQGLQRDRERTLRDFVHLNALHGTHARESVRAMSRLLADHPASASALEASLGWLRDVDLRPAVPALALPTVVVHGGRDALAPIEAGRWLAANLPRARFVELPDAAHLPFFTHRDAFVAALESLVA